MSSLMPQAHSERARQRSSDRVWVMTYLVAGGGGLDSGAVDSFNDSVDLGRVSRPAVQLKVPGDVQPQPLAAALLGIAEAVKERGAILQLPAIHGLPRVAAR